jgi:phage shock protein PspC (stress-responsive transcriptional regulator)
MTTNLPPGAPTSPTSGSGDAPGAAPAGTPGGPAALPLAEFFDRIRGLGVVRPDDGRWAAGVCAGIARRTGLDVVLVRGLFVILAVLGGGALFLYGLGWLLLPHADGRIHAQEVLRGTVTAGFVGSVIAVLSGVPSGFGPSWDSGAGWGFHPGGLGLLIGIGLVVWVVMAKRQHGPGGPGAPGGWNGPGAPPPPAGSVPASDPSAPSGTAPSTSSTPSDPSSPWGTPGTTPRASGSEEPPAPTSWATSATTGYAPAAVTVPTPPPAPDHSRPSHGLTRATLGAALVGGAAVALVDRFVTDVHLPFAVAAAVMLGVVGLGVVAAGLSGRRSGGLAPIAWLLAIVAVNAATIGSLDVRSGDVTFRPVSTTQAEAGFEHGAGDVRIDLTDPAIRTGATAADPVELSASLGAGRLVITVPAGTATRVDAQVGLGSIEDQVNRTTDGGAGRNATFTAGTGDVTLVVHAKVGAGQVLVVPQGSALAAGTTTSKEALR